MTTGLFVHKGVGQGRAFQMRKVREHRDRAVDRIVASTQRAQAERDERLTEFAEAMSEGFSLSQCADLVGVSVRTGQHYFRKICEDVEAAGLMVCE